MKISNIIRLYIEFFKKPGWVFFWVGLNYDNPAFKYNGSDFHISRHTHYTFLAVVCNRPKYGQQTAHFLASVHQ